MQEAEDLTNNHHTIIFKQSQSLKLGQQT